MMNNYEFVEKLKMLATGTKTVYALGMWGQPISKTIIDNKTKQLPDWYNEARVTDLEELIGTDTFGFDCVCMIKSILWGWEGDTTKNAGGAVYASNGVPDFGSDSLNLWEDLSDDFSEIQIGEIVWLPGHVGIYIGDGLVVECTPKWENGVQITAALNIGYKTGHNGRRWKKHAKLPWVDYKLNLSNDIEQPEFDNISISVIDWQNAAINDGYEFPKYGPDGIWGNECVDVATKALVQKYSYGYKNKNLTKIVQQKVGVEIDGLCGKNTRAAIIDFQKSNNLKPDGIVGLKTWKKILGK